jgi:hypothetical protein
MFIDFLIIGLMFSNNKNIKKEILSGGLRSSKTIKPC